MKKLNFGTTTSFILLTASVCMMLSCGDAASIQEAHKIEDSKEPMINLDQGFHEYVA